MAELEDLEQEELDRNLLEVPETDTLPSVPSTSLPARPGTRTRILLPGLYSSLTSHRRS